MEKDVLTFQDIILKLQQFWASKGCIVLQPYDSEVGAGTFHTATTLLGIVLSAVDKGTLSALAKGFGEIDIELGSNKRMNLFIESHSNIPLF